MERLLYLMVSLLSRYRHSIDSANLHSPISFFNNQKKSLTDGLSTTTSSHDHSDSTHLTFVIDITYELT